MSDANGIDATNDANLHLVEMEKAAFKCIREGRSPEALVLLDRLPRAVVRPPLVKLARPEIERIRTALFEAGLLATRASRDAA